MPITLATVIRYALVVSIWLVVLALGARAASGDALHVVRRPRLLLRAMLAIFVVVPAFALAVSAASGLPAPIRVALVALSASPVPPVLPAKQMRAGATTSYALGLLVAAAAASLIATPLLVGLAARLFDVEMAISTAAVARTLLMSIAAPFALGLALGRLAPGAAGTIGRYARIVGMALLVAGLLVVLVTAWPRIVALVGNGSLLVLAAMSVVGLAAGHVLGGGDEPGCRTALALAAATRHPGVALAIAAASFPDRQKDLTAAVLLFLLVNLVVTTAYLRWTARGSAKALAARVAP